MAVSVILFVYKRKEYTEKIIECLDKQSLANETDLYIFSDGYKGTEDAEKVFEVRNIIKSYKEKASFKSVTIFESPYNKGLAKSVIEGVSSVLQEKEQVIVLEDDLLISDDYLEFMNRALQYYKEDKRINSIGGYIANYGIDFEYDIYFSRRFECWGWATWRDRWNAIEWSYEYWKKASRNISSIYRIARWGGIDLLVMLYDYVDGRIDSWAIRAACNEAMGKMYTVVPCRTKVTNNGFDGSGTNCGKDYRSNQLINNREVTLCPFYQNRDIQKKIFRYHSDYKRLLIRYGIMVKRYIIHLFDRNV